jgi:hypothetical protein
MDELTVAGCLAVYCIILKQQRRLRGMGSSPLVTAMSDDEETNRDLAAYNALLALWRSENPIKTTKLQVLLAVNAGLIAATQFAQQVLLLCLTGFAFSLVWGLSIARTTLSQQAWKIKLNDIAARHGGDPRFNVLDTVDAERRTPGWLRAIGGVSSRYYLIAAPLGLTAAWLIALLTAMTP